MTAVQNIKSTMTEKIDKTTAESIETGTLKDTGNKADDSAGSKADDSAGSKADDSTENTADENIDTTSGNVEHRGSEDNGSRPVESIEKINEAEDLHIVPLPSSGTKPRRPYVGMIFSSIREAEVSYQDYGRENGFIIRRRSTYKAQRGSIITRVLFTCSCEGLHKKKCSVGDEGTCKKSRTMRTNCKAMMRIIWDRDSDDWVVNDFTDDHNHVMVTPTKRVLMGSNKYMPHSIMTKWMKDANRDEAVLPNEFLMHERLVGSEAMRISHLCRRSTQLAYLAGRSDEGYKVVIDILDQAFEKVKQLDSAVSEKDEEPSDEMCTSIADAIIVSPISQEKGNNRVRKGKDKATDVTSETYQSRGGIEISEGNKRPRVCKTCSGQGHDSRNCKNKEIESIDKDLCRNGADVDDVLQLNDGVEVPSVQVE